MNYKRILLGLLFSPILIPCMIIFFLIYGFVFGIEYVLTGKSNKIGRGGYSEI